MAGKRYRYDVVFATAFPMDMLRHDRAYPYDSGSANSIARSQNYDCIVIDRKSNALPYRATLVGEGFPTCDRWASFGPVSVDLDTVTPLPR